MKSKIVLVLIVSLLLFLQAYAIAGNVEVKGYIVNQTEKFMVFKLYSDANNEFLWKKDCYPANAVDVLLPHGKYTLYVYVKGKMERMVWFEINKKTSNNFKVNLEDKK